MDINQISSLLNSYKNGKISESDAIETLKKLPFEDLGFAKVDHHRTLRNGYPEVIFCSGKTPEHTAKIAESILKDSEIGLIASRAEKAHFDAILQIAPDAVYHESARMVTIKRKTLPRPRGTICVLTAGTSDIPVAEEAALTSEMLGNAVERIYDVGVAGIHRLFARLDQIESASVIIAVAGMEGALASVVGGLCDKPIIAVPTSIGYGSSFHGLAALLAMLNSCASGIGVVNIDNGFGAGWLAARINRMTGMS